MNKNNSELERRAAELGLTHEDPKPVQRAKAPVATADRVLLGVGCCLLAAGSAALNVWLVVPTLVVSGIAAAVLVCHLSAAKLLRQPPQTEFESELDGGWLLDRLNDAERERQEKRNRDMALNPLYRSMPINIHHDHDRHDRM